MTGQPQGQDAQSRKTASDLLRYSSFNDLPDDDDAFASRSVYLFRPGLPGKVSKADKDIAKVEEYLRSKWECSDAMPPPFDPYELETVLKCKCDNSIRGETSIKVRDKHVPKEEASPGLSADLTSLEDTSSPLGLYPNQINSSTESFSDNVSITSSLDSESELEGYESEVTLNEGVAENITRVRPRANAVESTALTVLEPVNRTPTPRIRRGSKPPLSRSAFHGGGVPCLNESCKKHKVAKNPAHFPRAPKYFPYESRRGRSLSIEYFRPKLDMVRGILYEIRINDAQLGLRSGLATRAPFILRHQVTVAAMSRYFGFLIASCFAALGAASPFTHSATSLGIVPRDTFSSKLSWRLLPTGSTAQFRGLAPVSDKVVWVSGTGGTVLRSTDGGTTWESVGPTLTGDEATLEFRDIEAWSADKAVVLSIGEGADSRVYSTIDGGATWVQSFTNQEATAFYDCFAFEDDEHGLAMSDPVDGKFRLIETLDGGETWEIVDPTGMPPALAGEFGFAASGTCLETTAGRWYLASGGVDPGRIFRSEDGYQWEVASSTIAGGGAGGVFSVQFRDANHGIAVGGDFEAPTGATNNAAWSGDGGATWTSSTSFPGGYRSGSSWVPGLYRAALAVGPTGSDFSIDGGRTWHGFDNGTFDSVECVKGYTCWASGSRGRVARLVIG